ncbi:PIR protein, putative [Plasmodium sp.]|nr:PIR protein, putative [Plasmodium sp.]
MNIYYVKMLLFIFLINTFVLPHNENYINNHYNINLIPKNIQGTIIKSRLLAQTEKHNPHYHNDPELKQIIDKLNEEAIKEYQRTHHPYKQLKEVVEKNGTKTRNGHAAEPMSTIEKELLETYEEMFDDKNHIMLKSFTYTNNDESDDSSSCACTDINNGKLAKIKGKDKYLVKLKERCKGGISFCSVGSILLTLIGLIAARIAAASAFDVPVLLVNYSTCASHLTIFNMFSSATLGASLKGGTAVCAGSGAADFAGTASLWAMAAFEPCGITALVLLILAVVLIILYIWLYRRRKRSWKHECKKHLCK